MKNKILLLLLFVMMIFIIIFSSLYSNFEPQNISIQPYNKGLQSFVKWNNKLNLGNVTIYRQHLPNGPLIKLTTTKSTSYIDKTVIPGYRYKYILTKKFSIFHKSRTSDFYLNDNFTNIKKQLISQINSHFTSKKPLQNWIYDDALGVVVYSLEGDQKKASRILMNLEKIQNPNGSINFFYFRDGRKSEKYIRNGALAWVGYAAAVYQKEFNDTRFQSFNFKIADYLIKSQPQKGAVTGGEGTYSESGVYLPDEVTWYSTEHNIDCYYYFRELARITNNKNYLNITKAFKDNLLNRFWDNDHGYFRIGIKDLSGEQNQPSDYALDTLSWGGIFLLETGELDKSTHIPYWLRKFLLTIEDDNTSSFLGYGLQETNKYKDASIKNIWVEGTWGVILFNLRKGTDCSYLIASVEKIYTTKETSFSDKAWGYLIMRNPNSIWPYHNINYQQF